MVADQEKLDCRSAIFELVGDVETGEKTAMKGKKIRLTMSSVSSR